MTTTTYESVDQLRKEVVHGASRSNLLFSDRLMTWERYRIDGFNSSARTGSIFSKTANGQDYHVYSKMYSQSLAQISRVGIVAPSVIVAMDASSRVGSVQANGEMYIISSDARKKTWGIYPSVRAMGVLVADPAEEEVASLRLSASINWKIFIEMDDVWLVLIHIRGVHFRLYAMQEAPVSPVSANVAAELGGTEIRGELTLLAIMDKAELAISSAYHEVLEGESHAIVAAVACVARNIILCDAHFN